IPDGDQEVQPAFSCLRGPSGTGFPAKGSPHDSESREYVIMDALPIMRSPPFLILLCRFLLNHQPVFSRYFLRLLMVTGCTALIRLAESRPKLEVLSESEI